MNELLILFSKFFINLELKRRQIYMIKGSCLTHPNVVVKDADDVIFYEIAESLESR